MPSSKDAKVAIQKVVKKRTDWRRKDRDSDLAKAARRKRMEEMHQRNRAAMQERLRLLSEYETDPESVLEPLRRQCPYCEKQIDPIVHYLPAALGGITVHPSETCTCWQSQEALRLEAGKAQEQKREFQRQEWVRTLVEAGLTGKLTQMTFDSYECQNDEQREWKEHARRYCDALLAGTLGDTPWLILHGAFGTGKSHLGCAILHEALRQGWKRCYFRPWTAYLRRLMNSFASDAEERTGDITLELMSGRLLILDDLDGKEGGNSAFAGGELFTALNQRYNDRAPTVLTFNHDLLEMIPWLGTAVVDRIAEAQFSVVRFDGPSYRSNIKWGE